MTEPEAMSAIWPGMPVAPRQDEKGNWIVYLPGKASPVTLTPEDYELWKAEQQKAKR